jgi:hypothetical protein
MNDMGPAERKRLNMEVAEKLGHAPEHAFNMQKFREEVMPAHQKAHEEFMRKSLAAKKAWHMQEEKEMTPDDVNKHPEVMRYEHEFMRKTPAMRSVFGSNPGAPAFRRAANKGGMKSKRKMHKKSKKPKKTMRKKTRAKKSHKKRGTRR